MTVVYDDNLAALQASITAFANQIESRLVAGKDAATLEGHSLDQIMELIATTAGLTVAEVQTQLDDLIADLTNVPRVKADATTALDDTNNDAIMTPQAFWTALGSFWSQQVGAAPETLNEIHEIATAISNNQSAIDAIEANAANKATITQLNDAVAQLQGEIAASVVSAASQAEVDAGVVTDKYVAPNTLKVYVQAVRTEMEADVNNILTSLTTTFDDATAIITPAP